MEPAESNGLLRCPTPIASHRPLISHQIPRETCVRRQREMYHKCFLCTNSALQQARFGEMFREKTLPAAPPAPILGRDRWPATADARLRTDPSSAAPRARVDAGHS